MNFRTQNFKRFLLAFVGFTTCFWFFFMGVFDGFTHIFISIVISLLISITMFYDPKKYTNAKKKAEQEELENSTSDKSDTN